MARIVSHSPLAHSLAENSLSLSSAQLGTDALHQQFTQHVLDPINLLAMTAGGLSYKLARVASMSALSALPALIRSPLISALSLSVEVAAFRGVNHAFSMNPESFLDRQGFAREMFTFASLKGVAALFKGGNFLTMHAAQNFGMMLGEELGAHLYLSAPSQKSFAERFMNASTQSLALGCGTVFSSLLIPFRNLQFSGQMRNSRSKLMPELKRGLSFEMASEEGNKGRSNVLHSFVERRASQLQKSRPSVQRVLEPIDPSAAPLDPHYARKVGEALDAYFNNRATSDQMRILEGDEMGRVILDSAGRIQ